jgi:uncharacterized ferritin-like protein (DUF455 family)
MITATEILSLFLERDANKKAHAVKQLCYPWLDEHVYKPESLNELPLQAGHPEKPKLVSPRELPKRGLGSQHGRAALLHAIAHIEFNAINLALDAILRFPEMPEDYYQDWLRVAGEEAYHFLLVSDHLKSYDMEYGDLSAHNGLWQLAVDTADDCLTRMAMVPRVMEARGLDVTPNLMQSLSLAGDNAAADILAIILRDEIGHVAVGNRWFKYLCEQRQQNPLQTFERLSEQYLNTQLKGPYAREARLKAGFDAEELDWLEATYP